MKWAIGPIVANGPGGWPLGAHLGIFGVGIAGYAGDEGRRVAVSSGNELSVDERGRVVVGSTLAEPGRREADGSDLAEPDRREADGSDLAGPLEDKREGGLGEFPSPVVTEVREGGGSLQARRLPSRRCTQEPTGGKQRTG